MHQLGNCVRARPEVANGVRSARWRAENALAREGNSAWRLKVWNRSVTCGFGVERPAVVGDVPVIWYDRRAGFQMPLAVCTRHPGVLLSGLDSSKGRGMPRCGGKFKGWYDEANRLGGPQGAQIVPAC